MIENRDNYVYVTGDLRSKDDDGNYLIVIDGGIMTRREKPEILRGEDICFLKECVCARQATLGVPRTDALRNFTRKLSVEQLRDLVGNYDSLLSRYWIKTDRYESVPDKVSASDLGLRAPTFLSYLNALGLRDDIPAVAGSVMRGLEKEPIEDMLNKLPRLSIRALSLLPGSMTDGIRSVWSFPFHGETEQIGEYQVPVSIGSSSFMQASGYGRLLGEDEGWYKEGYVFRADKITDVAGDSSSFRLYVTANGMIDSIDTYFCVSTDYYRSESADEGWVDDHYHERHLLKGPTITGPGQYVSVPVSALVGAWKAHVENEHDFNLSPLGTISGSHVVTFEFTCSLDYFGVVVKMKAAYTEV